ncbi:copper resistance protein B [Sphingobium subterraneum]|uniref:copper resistance protein B n=1 Tax=Sphingobium subterraneum TaxID=627688 RepID=UPI003CCCA1F4
MPGSNSHDESISQWSIFQPRAEFNFAVQDMLVIRAVASLSRSKLGSGLRNVIRNELMPYVAIGWAMKFDDVALLRHWRGRFRIWSKSRPT